MNLLINLVDSGLKEIYSDLLDTVWDKYGCILDWVTQKSPLLSLYSSRYDEI